MEYLLTYGWAILIMLGAIAALFTLGLFSTGTLAPKAQPGNCQIQRPDGPGTTFLVSPAGLCAGEQPNFVATFTNTVIAYAPKSRPINSAWNGGSWTIVAWVRVDSMTGTPNNKFIAEETLGCTSGLWVNPDGSIGVQFQTIEWYGGNAINPCASAGGVGITSSVIVPYGTWAMATAEFQYGSQAGNYVTVCTNTVCTSQAWGTPPHGPDDYANYSYDWAFGSGSCCGSPNLVLDLSNLQLYNTALTQTQINEIYSYGIGGVPPYLQNLVGWWPLNGQLTDYSNEGGNATASGSITYTNAWSNGYTVLG